MMDNQKAVVCPVVAFGVTEAVQFMMSTNVAVSPGGIYVGTAAKLLILAVAYVWPALLDRLFRPRVASVWAALFASSVAVLCMSEGPLADFVAIFVFYACEMTAVLLSGKLLFELIETKRVASAALAGMLAAFVLALVVFSLPTFFATLLKVLLAAGCALVPRFCGERPGVERANAGLGPLKAPHAPAVLLITVCFFVVAIQISYLNLWDGCDWSAAFAVAVVASVALMVAEEKAMRAGGLSLIDLTSAVLVAVPAIFVGAGVGESSVLISLSSIGFYLFLPRVFQVTAGMADGGTSVWALRALVETELVLSLAEAGSTVLLESGILLEFGRSYTFGISVAVAMGCILSTFALYEMRTRSIICDFMETGSPSERGSSETDEMPRDGENVIEACSRIAEKGGLTERERDMLMLLVQGKTLIEMCGDAGVSMNTTKSHVYHIYQKLGIHSRGELDCLVAGEMGPHTAECEAV